MGKLSSLRSCVCQYRYLSNASTTPRTSSSSKEASSSDPYNALISYLPESSAAGSSSKGRLNSLRVSIKQNFTSSDAPTSCASRTLAGYTSPFDATVVSLLRQHGANIVGKTNMDEFGMGSYGLHSYHGHVSNPLEPSRVAGGSSSGAAASVAAGLCDACVIHCILT